MVRVFYIFQKELVLMDENLRRKVIEALLKAQEGGLSRTSLEKITKAKKMEEFLKELCESNWIVSQLKGRWPHYWALPFAPQDFLGSPQEKKAQKKIKDFFSHHKESIRISHFIDNLGMPKYLAKSVIFQLVIEGKLSLVLCESWDILKGDVVIEIQDKKYTKIRNNL